MFSIFLLGAWAVRALVFRDGRLTSSPVILPTLGLILVWTLAYLFSVIVRDPRVTVWATFDLAQIGGLMVAIVPASILLLALNVGHDVRWIRLSVWSFIAVGVVAGLAFFAGAGNQANQVFETGGLFTMWLVALALGQALFNQHLPAWSRVGLVGLAAAWLFKAAVLQSWWFSGWLPSVVAVAVITLLWSRRAFVGLAVLSAIVAVVRWESLYDAIWGQTVRKGDLTRIDIWTQALDLWQQYPLLGTGPAGYAIYNMSFYRGSQFSMSTHNNYLDVLAETGILGCIAFAAFFIVLLRVGWTARTRWRFGFVGGFAQGAFGGLLALLVAMSQGDWFIPFVYNQTIAGYRYTVHSWVFIGFLAALAALRPANDPAESKPVAKKAPSAFG
jgi:O-antigen ligase